MINKLWASFIIVGIIFSLFSGNVVSINEELINYPVEIFKIFFNMIPLMVIWSGIMNIAKDAGVLSLIAKFMSPLFRIIFPDIPNNHESLQYIASNITINMLGIHNASTPFGLKAMKSLNELNKDKKSASRSMITFLVLNTSGVTIIATDIIAIRSMYGADNPTGILVVTILGTIIALIFALLIDKIFYKINGEK